ncbi:tlde1 domain-containing protein [Nitrosospira briensis]|uniref:tlde1 domain-containing protein n=1 Tax=Nitrosospira briensis TaxID=35799 RepID=UPI0008E5A06D|nr:tlde1 domain-containing protein [Nitrosospira briensis]SFN91476.1 Protein of unknown function [Nitrosospira briensis]
MSDRYSEERYNPSLAMCTSLKLFFDGSKLKMTGGSKAYSYPAASGRPREDGKFSYTQKAQMASFSGPIPEGVYWINPDELWTNRWYKRASEASWGKYRITVHPFPTTETYKRGGFFIHGGKVLGSAGCIDLTSHIEAFVADLEKEGAIKKCQIHLTVKYQESSK